MRRSIFPRVLDKNIGNCLFNKITQCAFKKTWKAKLPTHHIAHQHHKFLTKPLKLKQIGLHLIEVLTATFDAAINFFEEIIRDAINLTQHLLTAIFFTESDAIVQCRHFEGLLKHTQIGQCPHIAQSEVGRHHGLKVYTNQRHEILRSTNTPSSFLFLIRGTSKYIW